MQATRSLLAFAILLMFLAVPARAAERAFLYDEDPDNRYGHQYPGTVVWCLNRIKSADGRDDVEILAKVDMAERRLKMDLSLRRNADASLPASHVIDLKLDVPADFNGGGVALVPGLLMKNTEKAKGAALRTATAKVTDSQFMIALSNTAADRAINVASLVQREWFDLPFVYRTQRRGILAIEKGLSGRLVFQAAFAAWGDAPNEAAFDPPRCVDEVSSYPAEETRAGTRLARREGPLDFALRN